MKLEAMTFEEIYLIFVNDFFKLWNRTFFSLPLYFVLALFSIKPKYFYLRVSNQVSKIISQEKKVIFSAFNLASYSFIFQIRNFAIQTWIHFS